VVVYRDGAARASQTLPFTTEDSIDPERLWQHLADYETWDKGNLNLSEVKTNGMLQHEYARSALKDPYSGNLDRIQIIKGRLDASGTLEERIYDVAVSDGRSIGSDGRCRTSVGDTVDLETGTWTNTIGDPELIAVWKDPDFDPGQRAFYYARVLEIPTPRWTLYDALRLGADVPTEAPMTTQERAYTCPIWYTP